jgi:hypothetical protein
MEYLKLSEATTAAHPTVLAARVPVRGVVLSLDHHHR